MEFRAFSEVLVYSDPEGSSQISCVERSGLHLFIGSKHGTVRRLLLSNDQLRAREGGVRRVGSAHAVVQLRAVPLFHHLLVLLDRGLSARNMLSLDPVQALKRIHNVSLFQVSDAAVSCDGCVTMVTSSAGSRAVRVHSVGSDRWEVLRELVLLQEPVALALEGAVLCVATCDHYLLCDVERGRGQRGRSHELFPHQHQRRRNLVTSAGPSEFLLHGPHDLGLFVTSTGTCERPPVQWTLDVVAAVVCFPYVVTARPQMLTVYSILDQQRKQDLSLRGALGLLATPDGPVVFSDRDVYLLRPVPLDQQIQMLDQQDRVQEALQLLDAAQSPDTITSEQQQQLQKRLRCLSGLVHFFLHDFSAASDLFIQAELDPRELLVLVPDLRTCLSGDFQPQFEQRSRKLRELHGDRDQSLESARTCSEFLALFLAAGRGPGPGSEEVDSALLRLYTELGQTDRLLQLLRLHNHCRLDLGSTVLQQHHRFFMLGFLYLSHGRNEEALKTWVQITEGSLADPTPCSDVYSHIVVTLSRLKDPHTVWAFANWTLDRDQQAGVQIFTRRPADLQLEVQDVLVLLEKYPLALILYLEYLIHDLSSQEEELHSRLLLAYVGQILQVNPGTDQSQTLEKLQHMLWESPFYDVSTVYEKVKSTELHVAKAVLLGRSGNHSQALQVLVHQERDLQAAHAYCRRAARGHNPSLVQDLLLNLLQIYLSSEDLVCTAVDLLNQEPQAFPAEQVLRLLPNSCSVQLLSRFLMRSVRGTSHRGRMVRLQEALARAELTRVRVMRMQASRTKLRLDPEQKCRVCRKRLEEPQFAWNLEGDLMHVGCSADVWTP